MASTPNAKSIVYVSPMGVLYCVYINILLLELSSCTLFPSERFQRADLRTGTIHVWVFLPCSDCRSITSTCSVGICPCDERPDQPRIFIVAVRYNMFIHSIGNSARPFECVQT